MSIDSHPEFLGMRNDPKSAESVLNPIQRRGRRRESVRLAPGDVLWMAIARKNVGAPRERGQAAHFVKASARRIRQVGKAFPVRKACPEGILMI
jgi:hypothetical protein